MWKKKAPWRVPVIAATVAVMVVGIGVVRANAVVDDPTQNTCITNSSGTLSIGATSLALGQSTTANWTLNRAPACAMTPYLVFHDAIAGNDYFLPGGTGVVTPQATGRYRLLVFSGGFYYTMAETPTVSVTLPVVNGRPLASITRGGDQTALFAQGISTPNAVVSIRGDVELDLSWGKPLVVASGVHIIGQRDAAHPSGPRLFSTLFHEHRMLSVGDDNDNGHASNNVRITGIRFDGTESDDPCDSSGDSTPDVNAVVVFSGQNVEIDHNEFYHWTGSTVLVYDPAGLLNRDSAGTVWVHDNYIHDNQHPTYCGPNPLGSQHGGGYGVQVNGGGFAKIEHNVFSANRHAVSANGSDGDGYDLVGNLFLAPGIDRVIGVWGEGYVTYNHHIDVHGQDTCPWINREHYNCGRAGEYFDVRYNTVVGFRDTPNWADSIQLRGTPTSYVAPSTGGMQVLGNVFAVDSSHAETQPDTVVGLVDAGQNTFSADLRGFWVTEGVHPCDFDGDRVNDAFRASGASWWYYSTRAARWVALDTAQSTSVTFGDVNNDGLCDVTSGSTRLTQPWLENVPALATTAPNLVGATQSAALLSLVSKGLIAGTVTSVANAAPAGTVISAYPAAGAAARIGSPVNLVVSLGGLQVPNVVGFDEADARQAIRAAGLSVGSVTKVRDDGWPGTVLSQTPNGGGVAAAGTPVKLRVSLGPAPSPNCAVVCE